MTYHQMMPVSFYGQTVSAVEGKSSQSVCDERVDEDSTSISCQCPYWAMCCRLFFRGVQWKSRFGESFGWTTAALWNSGIFPMEMAGTPEWPITIKWSMSWLCNELPTLFWGLQWRIACKYGPAKNAPGLWNSGIISNSKGVYHRRRGNCQVVNVLVGQYDADHFSEASHEEIAYEYEAAAKTAGLWKYRIFPMEKTVTPEGRKLSNVNVLVGQCVADLVLRRLQLRKSPTNIKYIPAQNAAMLWNSAIFPMENGGTTEER